ncbi:hypothetical protein [Peribacillus simplex]|uniref:hypothetical protein n=1 Tax=Peribacillus simplex TaxID=1478 RepID=UPI0036706CB3
MNNWGFPFYDEELEKLEDGTKLKKLVSYVERLAGRKLRNSEVQLLPTLYVDTYMKGREDGWEDVFSMDAETLIAWSENASGFLFKMKGRLWENDTINTI